MENDFVSICERNRAVFCITFCFSLGGILNCFSGRGVEEGEREKATPAVAEKL
jgi:hypothetical protein